MYNSRTVCFTTLLFLPPWYYISFLLSSLLYALYSPSIGCCFLLSGILVHIVNNISLMYYVCATY